MSSEKCDKDVYENGIDVLITHSISTEQMEGWRKKVSARLNMKVDWFFFGGRIVVRILGDVKIFRNDFKEKGQHELFEFQRKSYEKVGMPRTKLDFMWSI